MANDSGRLASLLPDLGAAGLERPETKFGSQLAKGRGYESNGRYGAARPLYEKLITEFPDRHEPYHRLAVLSDKQRRHREAQSLYQQAIQLEPQNAELFNDLGYSYYLDGQLDKAESAIRKAVALDAGNSRFHNNLGLIKGAQGRWAESFDEFCQAGSKADAHYNMAFLFAARGDFQQAKQSFRMAINFDPRHEGARGALESFERFERDPNDIAQIGEYIEDGVRWIPYVEPGDEPPANDSAASSESGRQTAGRRNFTGAESSRPNQINPQAS